MASMVRAGAAAAIVALMAAVPAAHATFPGRNGRIAFDDGTGRLYSLDASGRKARYIGRGVQPAFSADGRSLAFSSFAEFSDGTGSSQIYRARGGGSGRTRLTPGPNPAENPSWSPDGTQLAFSYGGFGADDFSAGPGAGGFARGIYVVAAAGGKPVLVARDGVAPAWSPSGLIAYASDHNRRGILLIRPDCTGARRVTTRSDGQPD